MLRCNVRDWSLSSRMSLSPPPPPLSLSLSLSLYIASCRQATRRSQVIIVVTQQNLVAKKKPLSHPLFVLFFVSLSLSFGHVVLTLTENRPEDVDFKLLKQRRKKSGPPCGVDFKRELTSSVLTSRGFHCTCKLDKFKLSMNLRKSNKFKNSEGICVCVFFSINFY